MFDYMNYESMNHVDDHKCGVVGCDNPEFLDTDWDKDHPNCTPVALCEFHYKNY